MSSHDSNPLQVAKAGVAYFALVFAAGFLLGSIRVPFLVPRVGERIAELIETPFMFVVVVAAARFITLRHALPTQAAVRLAVGFVGLALLVATELALAAVLQRRSPVDFIVSRDPVSGTVFALMLVLFALMPFILGRLQSGRARHAA
jgi:hypothetical protein